MEFTVSRVVLCICGAVILVAACSAIGGMNDQDVSDMDDATVGRIARMLDAFMSSDVDEMILDGVRILPEGYSIRVHDNFVELHGKNKVSIAVTTFDQDLKLDWNETKTVIRQRSQRSCARCP